MTRFCSAVILILSCILLVHGAWAVGLAYEDAFSSPFGAGSVKGYAEDLGVHWTRAPVNVDADTWDETAVLKMFDTIVRESARNNVTVFGIINPAQKNGEWLTAEQYAAAVGYLVERYDGDGVDDMEGLIYPVRTWELMNEYSSTMSRAYAGLSREEFVAFFAAGKTAARTACPSALIAYDPFDETDTEALLSSLSPSDIDIVVLHTYSPLDVPADSNFPYYAPNFAGYLQRLGLSGKPVWATEYAMYDHAGMTPPPNYVPAGDQGDNARWFVQTTAWGLGSGAFDKIIYTEVETPLDAQNDARLGWMALIDRSGVKRPIYYAFKKMAGLIGGFEGAGMADIGEDVYACSFRAGDRTVWCIWSKETAGVRENVTLDGLQGTCALITAAVPDENGVFEHWTQEIEGDRLVIRELTSMPLYIEPYEGAPMADFTANTTSGQIPLTVHFTDLSTGTPAAWAWSFGDGNASAFQNPTHTYAAPGNYTVSLSLNGGADTCTRPAYIKVTPLLYGDANDDGAVDQADTLRVLREVVGLKEKPAAGTELFTKTDVHTNGAIEVGDALFIAQHNVGLRDVWFELV